MKAKTPAAYAGERYRDSHHALFGALTNRLHPEILWHGYTRGDSGWRHFHPRPPYHRLYFFFKGEAFVRPGASAVEFKGGKEGREGGWVALRPGHVYLLPSAVGWQLHAEGPFEKFFIHFRLEPWPGRDLVASRRFDPLPVTAPCPAGPRLAELAAGGITEVLRFNREMFSVLLDLLAMGEESTPPADDRLLVEKYLQVFHAAETMAFGEWSPKRLSATMQRSLPSLARSFQRDTGMTLNGFFRERLLRRAGDMLLTDGRSIREIAQAMGFEDEHYFSRYFRKGKGLSPREWRDRYRIG